MINLNELFDKYNGGVEPLENWETADLADLECAINAELQDRGRMAQPADFRDTFFDDSEFPNDD